VTFITLPGIDDVSRISGFLAILLSASSLISAVVALFRYKSDIEHPVAYPRGEGLILLSVCAIGTTFNLIADSESEAAKCSPISSPGLFALRDRSIHYWHSTVCPPGVDINGERTPLRGLYAVDSHMYSRRAGLHTFHLTIVDSLIFVQCTVY
jgi:hypothetical protein